MKETWSEGCQSILEQCRLNGTVSIMLLIGETTSSPSCPAGQFLIAKLPDMKSFCTSTTTKAELGRATFLIHSAQHTANSSLKIVPLVLTLKMLNSSSTS